MTTPGQTSLLEGPDDHPFPTDYAHRWQMVKSVPEDPHEYVVRAKLDDAGKAAYNEFVRFIRLHGERRLWRWSPTARPKPYWYWTQDGYEFWEAPVGLVNRKPVGQKRKVATCPECGQVGILTEVGKAMPHDDCDFRGAAILNEA